MEKIGFDASLPKMAECLAAHFGAEVVSRGVFVRDISGRLTFVAADALDAALILKAEKAVTQTLPNYVDADAIILDSKNPVSVRLLNDPNRLPISVGGIPYQLIDRRIVGSGWLEIPVSTTATPPRIVFASLKGGVGRSTALAVAAADFAIRNKNVLVVDLDLEAPGLGNLLTHQQAVPDFGTIDYLVENGLGGVAKDILHRFVAASSLTTPLGARVDVVPAIGKLSTRNPENVLAKLARAMTEDIDNEGKTVTVSAQISQMISAFTDAGQYDVVLIDSRAGLAELTAPAILGLGAHVLLFGTAQSQNIEGYKALFSSLKTLASRDLARGQNADWRWRFKAVWAKASLDAQVGKRHIDNLFEIFSEIYDKEVDPFADLDSFSFDIDDPTAPHTPLVVPFNPTFSDWDPAQSPSHLAEPFYEQTFRPFINGIDSIIRSPE